MQITRKKIKTQSNNMLRFYLNSKTIFLSICFHLLLPVYFDFPISDAFSPI